MNIIDTKNELIRLKAATDDETVKSILERAEQDIGRYHACYLSDFAASFCVHCNDWTGREELEPGGHGAALVYICRVCNRRL